MKQKDITIINSGLNIRRPFIPVGPLRIAAVLNDIGYKVEFRDYQLKKVANKPSPLVFKNFCRHTADIIGISTFCNTLPTVLGAMRYLKEESPEKTVILGGAGATDIGAKILEHFPVDILVLGEGELTIVELMDALRDGNPLRYINGIAYRNKNGKVVVTKPRDRIKDLSEIPLPAYHHIDFDNYGNSAGIVTSRGCPYNCKFCSAHSIWQRKMTYRDLDDIYRELQLLAPYVDKVDFYDDTFVANKRRAMEIMDIVREFRLPFYCNGKIPLMDEELLQHMKKANCAQVFYGVESGSNHVLRKINKGHTHEQSREIIRLTSRYIDKISTLYIWGFPFATMEDFYSTVDCIFDDMKIPEVISQISQLSPLPSSDLTQEHRDKLRFSTENQARVGGLPLNHDLKDYPELYETIIQYPNLFPSFYYFEHDSFEKKRKIVRKIDWKFNKDKRKSYARKVFRSLSNS